MHRDNETSTLATVLRLLYQPVPYLPEMSFLERGRTEQRKRQAMARMKDKAPQERKLRGNIEMFGKGKCKICGHIVEINESTWIFGDIHNEAVAEMTVDCSRDAFIAKRIVMI